MTGLPELLAPAGDRAALEAALEAGASAVYFGLTTLNARRRAPNFSQPEFVEAVRAAHARGARAYVTLNTDLAERELGQAARILELARQAGADAVLVRDPALLALKPHYPELEFHFSTQTCMANGADVAGAAKLGAARVVLARELTLEEIAAASAVPGVQTEVFVQGALCFSVSGRCLLSSWMGGRSGNRGACTSPCRLPWKVAGQPRGTPLSMHDLAAPHRLAELRQAGVAALKIEGRLKNAAWVGEAVRLYRRALDGDDPDALLQGAAALGAYAGRSLTCAWLDGQREQLTGASARQPAPESLQPSDTRPRHAGEDRAAADAPAPLTYDLRVETSGPAVSLRCACGERVEEWSIPKTVVRRAHKAVSVGQLLGLLVARPILAHRLRRGEADDFEFLLVPRAVNALFDRISAVIHRACQAPDEQVRVELPEAVGRVLAAGSAHRDNRRQLGDKPDRVRLEAESVGDFLRHVRPGEVIVEGLTRGTLPKVLRACRGLPLIVALPQVFFDKDVAGMESLVGACAGAGVTVEVNSWGGWWLARQARARMESGPGLPVLNSLAASVLASQGIACVTLSPEADRRQLEQLSARCPAPCSLVVFGRPPLLTTRLKLEEAMRGQTFEDRRGARIAARLERGLWVFRPLEPFDLRGATNERIRVKHLVVDLVGSPDPVGDWLNVPLPGAKRGPLRFNYDRTLS